MVVLDFLGLLFLVAAVLLWRSKMVGYPSLAEGRPEAWRDGRFVFARSSGRYLRDVVLLAVGLRLAALAALVVTNANRALRLSPDSVKYHVVGMEIAREIRAGHWNWANWVDNGWFQFVGLVYAMVGVHPLVVQLINVAIGSATPVLVYFLARRAFNEERVARIAALLVAVFPSFIYYSCLLLKDPIAIAAFALLALCAVALRQKLEIRWLVGAVVALIIFLGVRDYLLIVGIILLAASLLLVRGHRPVRELARLAAVVVVVGVLTSLLGLGFLGLRYAMASRYFDLDYINQTRMNLGARGSGAIFEDPSQATWGSGLGNDLVAAGAAVFYFFFTLDPTNVGSVRQLMALPEVLGFVIFLPFVFRGMVVTWRQLRATATPLLVFTFGILVVYGSATTNMGALYRWRMQAMPFLLSFLALGVVWRGRGVVFRVLSRWVR